MWAIPGGPKHANGWCIHERYSLYPGVLPVVSAASCFSKTRRGTRCTRAGGSGAPLRDALNTSDVRLGNTIQQFIAGKWSWWHRYAFYDVGWGCFIPFSCWTWLYSATQCLGCARRPKLYYTHQFIALHNLHYICA